MSETTEAEEVTALEQAMRDADEPMFDIPRLLPYRQFATIAVKFMRQRLIDVADYELGGDDLRRVAEEFYPTGDSRFEELQAEEYGRIRGQLHVLAAALDHQQREADRRKRERDIRDLEMEIAAKRGAHMQHIREGAGTAGIFGLVTGIVLMWTFHGWGSGLAWLGTIALVAVGAVAGGIAFRHGDRSTLARIRHLARRRDALLMGETDE